MRVWVLSLWLVCCATPSHQTTVAPVWERQDRVVPKLYASPPPQGEPLLVLVPKGAPKFATLEAARSAKRAPYVPDIREDAGEALALGTVTHRVYEDHGDIVEVADWIGKECGERRHRRADLFETRGFVRKHDLLPTLAKPYTASPTPEVTYTLNQGVPVVFRRTSVGALEAFGVWGGAGWRIDPTSASLTLMYTLSAPPLRRYGDHHGLYSRPEVSLEAIGGPQREVFLPLGRYRPYRGWRSIEFEGRYNSPTRITLYDECVLVRTSERLPPGEPFPPTARSLVTPWRAQPRLAIRAKKGATLEVGGHTVGWLREDVYFHTRERACFPGALGFVEPLCVARDDVALDCRKPCAREQRCTPNDDHSTCVTGPGDCWDSKACRREGRCTTYQNRCIATTDEMCQRARVCTTKRQDVKPRCRAHDGACVVDKPRDCASHPVCKEYGQCFPNAFGQCVVRTDAACLASKECQRSGRCSAPSDPHASGSSRCVVVHEAECERSKECASRGACGLHPRGAFCVVDDTLDCERSQQCKERGDCALLRGWCRPRTTEHCKKSMGCKKHGWCTRMMGTPPEPSTPGNPLGLGRWRGIKVWHCAAPTNQATPANGARVTPSRK